ncbi:MAG TPA: lysozyme [Terriglobales bacterium]|nr:lysozyme [Terriglobales bacterium]
MTKSFEGLKLAAYRDQGGVWTIGYGHTGPDVHEGLTITTEQAEALLVDDLANAVACVNRQVTGTINQNQFDALVDFAFNLGCETLGRSTLLRCVNSGAFTSAALQFPLWAHVKGQLIPGLVRRRQAEMNMFKGVYKTEESVQQRL